MSSDEPPQAVSHSDISKVLTACEWRRLFFILFSRNARSGVKVARFCDVAEALC